MLFVWSRDAGNVEAPYRASERVLLHAWALVRDDLAKSTAAAAEIGATFAELVELHFTIWDALIGAKILPHVKTRHAVSSAVASGAAVDVNLKLFELLGRMAMRGLWHLWFKSGTAALPEQRDEWDCPEATELAQAIVQLIRNNPILLTPLVDSHAVDIGVTLLFLTMMSEWTPAAINYSEGLIQRITYAYRSHNRYPTIHADYRQLVEHPRERNDAYREGETKGSSIFPLIGLWATLAGPTEASAYFADFAEQHLQHCNCQFWLAASDSEDALYTGGGNHGAALCDVPITQDGARAMEMLVSECGPTSAFMTLSAITLGHWPMLALACRHHRLPLPPDLWLPLVEQARPKPAPDADA
nr:hypothetical protein [Sphingomonas sp. Y57]